VLVLAVGEEQGVAAESEPVEDPLRALVRGEDEGLDPLQLHRAEGEVENRAEGLAHVAVTPRRRLQVVAQLGLAERRVDQAVEAGGTDEHRVVARRDSPAKPVPRPEQVEDVGPQLGLGCCAVGRWPKALSGRDLRAREVAQVPVDVVGGQLA